MMFNYKSMMDEEPYPRQMGNKSLHALKLQQHLYDQMLAQSEFCDVTLDIGGFEMKAHWSVLVFCPYFQSLYHSDMTEKQSGLLKIGIGKPAAVRSAITFLYTGQLEMTYDSVRDILEVADYLQIDDLKDACAKYLVSVDVTVKNCISLSLLASMYDLEIYSKVFNFVRGHLPEVMQQKETLTLTPESILELLQDTSLNYVSIEDFFSFIVKWVEFDAENREKHFESMFCELDLKKVTRQFIEDSVEVCTFVQNSTTCSMHVLNVKMEHMDGTLQNEPATDVVLVVGGCGVGQFFASFYSMPYFPLSDVITVNNVYGYIISENRWTELAPLPYTMRHPLVAYNKAENDLYVYDASTGLMENDLVYLYKYNVLGKSWTSVRISLPDNCDEITIQQLLHCRGKLYMVASGRSMESCTARSDWSVYLFRVSEDGLICDNKWRLCPRSTKTHVYGCVVAERYVCVLGCKCGTKSHGGAPNSGPKVTRFFFLDTVNNQKYECSRGVNFEPLMIPMKNELLLAKPGAYRYRKFNFSNKRWTTVRELLVPHPTEDPVRTDFIYTVHKGQLYMFGGKIPSTKKLIDTACSYDISERGPWTNMQTIPKALINSTAIVASIPKEMIRCHIDCPHCVFHSARSQASYQIDIPDNDEDEDDYSDGDDELYSDYYDEDMYVENMAEYDWF